MKKRRTWNTLLRNAAKLLVAFVVLTVALGPFQSVPIAYAQQGGSTLDDSGGAAGAGALPAGQTQQTIVKQDGRVSSQPPSAKEIGCELSGAGIAVCLTNVLYVVTVGIGSAFAYVAAMFFNFAISISLHSYSYALTFISSGWAVARDIANIFFILILIYIAFAVMLNADTAGMTRTLALVIVVALLVNFSFFFTRVVIDGGNILAIQFYNAINVPTVAETFTNTSGALKPASIIANTGQTKDLTAGIMNVLQLQNLFNSESFKQFVRVQQQGSGGGFLAVFISLTFLYVAAAIFLWLLTVAFVTNGIKFLVRVVVLWFVIIASPLAFVARTMPETKKYFDKWLHYLITHSFYPVVFLFIFLVLVTFTNQMSNCGSVTAGATNMSGCMTNEMFGQLQGIDPSQSGYVATIGLIVANIGIRLGFIIAILFIGMKIADEIGVMGASAATKFGAKVGGFYSGALRWTGRQSLRGASLTGGGLYTQTVGRGANAVKSSVSGSSWLGYRIKKGAEALTKSSVGGAKSYDEVLASKKARGAYALDVKNRETMQKLGTLAASDPTLDESYKELRELESLEAKAHDDMTDAEHTRYSELSGRVPGAAGARDDIKRRKAEKDMLVDTVRVFGKRELSELKGAEIEKILKYLSESQLKTLKDIDKFSDGEKRKWETQWHKESAESSLSKAHKQIGLLRELSTKLGGVAELENTIKSGNSITATSVKKVKETLESELKKADEEYEDARALPNNDATRKSKLAAAQAKRRIIQDGKKAADDLDSRRKEVRAGIDKEHGNAEEFTAK